MEKKKFTEADKIIYMNLGEGASYLYEEDYDDLIKAVNKNESEKFYEWIKPKLKEIDKKKEEEKKAFARIFELIKKNNEKQSDKIINYIGKLNESFKDFVELVIGEKTGEETTTFSQNILLLLNKGFVPATSALRDGLFKPTKDITFETVKDNYPVRVVFYEGGTKIEIECDDEDSEFFILDGGYVISAKPIGGVAVFDELQPGEYLLSMDMMDFMEIKVKGSDY